MIEIRPANAPVSSKKAKAPTETRPLGASGIEIRPKSENPYYAEQRPIADLAPSTPPVAPSPEMGLGDVAMEGAKGLARGGLGLAQSIGGAGVEMAGQLGAGAYDLLRTPQNFPGMTPGQLTEVEAARAALVPTQNPLEDQGQFAKQVFPAGSPIIAADPRASAENAPYLTTSPGIPQLARLAGEAGEMAPNAAATIGAAVATGGLGPAGALAGGAMGGGLEGLSEYQQVLDKGGSPVEALRAAAVMGAGAGALNAIPFVTYSTKFLPPSMRGTAARAMLSFIAEGSTETAEGGVSAIARMKSLPKSQEEWAEAYSKVERGIIDESNVFLVAGLMGGGTAIAAGGEPTIPSAGPVGVTIGPDSASPVDKLEPGRNAPLPEPERFEEDYAPFDLPAQEQAPTAPSTPQQSEAIPEPIQAPDNAVAPSPEAVVAPEPEPELSESEKQAEADLLAEFPELKGMLDAARRSGPLNDDLVNTILNADTVDSREIPKIEVRKPVSREESLSRLIKERPALDVGRPLDATTRPEEEGVPQGPARATVRAQDRPRPGERPTSAVPSPEVRATVRGPEPVASKEPALAKQPWEMTDEDLSATGVTEIGVKDDTGKPITFYHGTLNMKPGEPFTGMRLDISPSGRERNQDKGGADTLGMWFTSDPKEAPFYTQKMDTDMRESAVLPAYIKAKNPLVFNSPDEYMEWINGYASHYGGVKPGAGFGTADMKAVRERLALGGKDAIIIKNAAEKGVGTATWAVALKPEAIVASGPVRQTEIPGEEPVPAPGAEFVGLQERPRGQAPIALYNIPTPDGGKTTVTAETAKSQGFSVPEPPVRDPEEQEAPEAQSPVRATEIAPQPEVAPEAPASTLSPEDEARIKHYVTSARGPRNLFGDRFSAIRQEILRILTGTKPPKSKAGVTAVAEALYKHTNTPNGSISSMEDFVLDWASGKAQQEQPAPEAKPEAPKAAAFQEMVAEAQRWRGAAKNFDSSLTNDRDRLRLNNATTKGDLDAYLMKKFGIDASEARDVSNQLTRDNLPDDMTADPADFAQEPWAQIGNTAPTPKKTQATPSAYSPETQAIIDIYGDKTKALATLRKQSATAAKNKETNPATEKAIKELTEGPAPQQDDLFGAEEIQTSQADAKQTQLPKSNVEVVGVAQKAEYADAQNLALAAFRKEVRASGVRPTKGASKEEMGYMGQKIPWIKGSASRTADQWLERAYDLGLISDAERTEPSTISKLMSGTNQRGPMLSPEGVAIPGVNQKAPDTGKPSSVGDIMKGMGLTAEKSKRVQKADARIPKPKKGKADDESGYVNMSLFNPMEALRILRGKLKDGKFIEFEQGFMGLKDLKVARSGKIKSLQMRGKLIAQDFENAWRKEWQKQNPGVKAKTVRFRDMPAETVEALNDYLAEEDAGVKAQLLSELPEGLRRPATQMRDLVDQMSQELIDMGIVEDDVQKVIADQMGFYLRRTYAIFQDPKYRDNIPKAVEDNARKWLREKFPTYTTNQIESALADLKGVGSEKEALNRLVQMGGVLGKLDRRTLGKRNEYDQAILDLWGVDKNGIDNFLNTINAQAHMIANFEWLEDIKANGRGSVVLTPQDIAALPQGDERAQWPFLNESDSRKSVSMSTRPKDPAASRNKALDKFIAKAESQGDAGTVEVLKKTKALFEKGMKLEDGKEVVDSRNLEGASKYAEQLQAEADKLQAEGVAAPRGKKGPLKAKSRVAQSKANKINRQIKAILEAEEQKANAEPDTFGPFGPLAGARVHPEFKAALQEAVQIQEVAPWIQKWNWFNRQLKQNVTTRDPASALRNFRSGVDFSMANGWMLYDAKNVPKRLTKALSIANVDIRRSHDPALREEYLKMVEYGIAGDTAIVGELNEIQKEAKKAEFVKAAEKALSPELVKAMGGADALATKLYQVGDDAFKIFGALTEQEHLMEATGMDSDAALKEGAARVRRQFPTYSELHKMLQKFRRTPFIGPFVAYQSEVPRNAWNTIAQMATEIKSKNPKVRAMGYRRAVGIMWATVNRHAYKAAWMILLGLTYDDDERIGKALPEWYQGHEFAFTKGDRATGKYLGYNLSQADAYGPLKESFWAAMRGDNILDAAGDALMAFGGGYVAPQLGTQAVVDAYTGNDARGNSLYMKTDTVGEKAGKTLLHAVEALTPSPARRQAKAETVEEHVREVFGTLTGYRFIEIDLPTDLFWKAKDFKKYGTEQVRDAYAAARDGNTEAAKKQLKDLEAVRQDYFDELREAYLAFKATRISIDLLDAKLKEADLSAKEIEAVKYGTLEPYTPPQKLTDMME